MKYSVTAWQKGLRRGLRHEPRSKQPAGLMLLNAAGHMRIILGQLHTTNKLELPDDVVVFVFLSRDAATHLRDELLNPVEFPETV